MFKRVFAVLLCVLTLCAFAACNIRSEDDATTASQAVITTKPEEFVDNIPEFEFKNYVDAVSKEGEYSFNVVCSKQEYDAYYALILQCGYNMSATEYPDQYSAVNKNGYRVDMSFSGTELFVSFRFDSETTTK